MAVDKKDVERLKIVMSGVGFGKSFAALASRLAAERVAVERAKPTMFYIDEASILEYSRMDEYLSAHEFGTDLRYGPLYMRERITPVIEHNPHTENSSGRGQGRNPMAQASIKRMKR